MQINDIFKAWLVSSGVDENGGSARVTTVAAGSSNEDATLPFGTEVTVTETLTKVAEFKGGGLVEIEVTSNALDQFEIRAKADSGSEQTLYSSAADYTNPTGILTGTSGDLTVQAVGSGWFIIDPAVQTLVLYAASGNVAGSGVTIYA